MTYGRAIKIVGAEADRHGATLEESEGRNVSVIIDAPQGKLWKENDCHALYITLWYAKLEQAWNDDAVDEAVQAMRKGLYDCGEPDCDVCGEA